MFGVQSIISFIVILRTLLAFNMHKYIATKSNTMMMAWSGDRPPAANPLIYKQKMDAAWGRGKYRLITL